MSAGGALYLVRHAVAAERGDDWPDDAKRPLTGDGISRMRQVTAGLRNLDVDVRLIVTSPLVRALQTAEILAGGLKHSPDVRTLPALAPGGSPVKLADALSTIKLATGAAIVGHEPDLGEFAAWLIGAKAPIPFKKGGVCRIDLPGPPSARGGQLVWLATPKMLRALR